MTFAQAKKKLEGEAKGKYHSLAYDMGEHTDGEVSTSCRIYIDGDRAVYNGPTFEDAFRAREIAIDKPTSPMPEGMPALEEMMEAAA